MPAAMLQPPATFVKVAPTPLPVALRLARPPESVPLVRLIAGPVVSIRVSGAEAVRVLKPLPVRVPVEVKPRRRLSWPTVIPPDTDGAEPNPGRVASVP